MTLTCFWMGSVISDLLRRMLFLSQVNTQHLSMHQSMCPKRTRSLSIFLASYEFWRHGVSYSGIGIFLPLLYTTWPVYLKQDISISVHGALALARRRLSLAPPPGGPRWVRGAGRELGESVRRERKWQGEGGRRLGGGVKKLTHESHRLWRVWKNFVQNKKSRWPRQNIQKRR